MDTCYPICVANTPSIKNWIQMNKSTASQIALYSVLSAMDETWANAHKRT